MSDSLAIELASAFWADQAGESNKGLVRRFLHDPEVIALFSLLSAPELRVENNYPLPFTTPASALIGYEGGFLSPIESEGVGYSGFTQSLWERMGSLFGLGANPPVIRCLDFQSTFNGASGPFQVRVRADSESGGFHLEIPAFGRDKRVLEIWRAGSLALKAPAQILAGSPPFRFHPGEAVDIREAAASQGMRVLVVETEFAPEEWRSAFVSLCLAGDISEASRVLNHRRDAFGRFGESWEKVESQIRAIGVVTRSEGTLLRPVPVTRSEGVAQSDLMAVYGVVWKGILQCWPAAIAIPNPWSGAEGEEPLPQPRQTQPLAPEVRALAEVCVRMAKGEHMDEDVSPGAHTDPRIREGWTALFGWKALLSRQYEKARQIFSSEVGRKQDPFSLDLTQSLSRHLETCESNGGKDSEGSSDNVWKAVFSAFL